ncbi:MAG: hypothetical protein ACYTEG_08575 [Planctomycetota bacterium]|jgi:hypothetical protein
MGAVTYPDAAVDAYLNEHFVGFKLSLLDRHPDFKEAINGQAVAWAPTFLFTDGKGREVRRTVGWLSPTGFLAELRIARAQYLLTRGKFDEALVLLAEAGNAEALYYEGVAVFLKGKRDMAALGEKWNALVERFPDSEWASKASVVEDWDGRPHP